MIIGLVRDSFLRCFCQTCSVNSALPGRYHKKPLKKVQKKPKCKQPKKGRKYVATEIRCEEKSRGGMCYEVILAEPSADKPTPPAASPRPKSMTAEEIEQKLLQAEERRKSMEASRLASVGERMTRLEEANRKREETTATFIAATQAALEDKLDTTTNNREAYLNGLRAKLSDHLNNVDGVRKQLEAQTNDLRQTIEDKLRSAEENRTENLGKMLEKLKEHEDYSQKVRLGHEEAIRQLEERIQAKLVVASNKRESEMLKKLETLRERDRRAEMVRANKERIMAAEKQDAASSG